MYNLNYQAVPRQWAGRQDVYKNSSNPSPEEACQSQHKYLIYIGQTGMTICEELFNLGYASVAFSSVDKTVSWLLQTLESKGNLPDAIICGQEQISKSTKANLLSAFENNRQLSQIPFVLLASASSEGQPVSKDSFVDDLYTLGDFKVSELYERISFLNYFKPQLISKPQKNQSKNERGAKPQKQFKVRKSDFYVKRIFDIVLSGTILLLLSPVFLLVALIIKIESKGSAFYISKRVGTGYRVFDFYKFRTMYQDADKRLEELRHLNMYSGSEGASGFFKIKDDPRITPFGKFLRNTSIDELPQLLNVFLGDMSLVGNRPLPLYEAVTLTKDGSAKRFLAPAGITGLWQVTKRSKNDMSVEERIDLDVQYAHNVSFWFDMRIIAKTFPALIQEENV